MGDTEKGNKLSGSSQNSRSANLSKSKGSDWWPPEALEGPQSAGTKPGDEGTKILETALPEPLTPYASEILDDALPALKKHIETFYPGPNALDLGPHSVTTQLLNLVAIMIEEALIRYEKRLHERNQVMTKRAIEAGERLREEFNRST
jgi:hypothetical protein